MDAIKKSGGLILFWKNSIEVTLLSYTKGHTDCIIQYEDKRWRFTGFYGNPDKSLRIFSWELLKRRSLDKSVNDLPWLIGGDFNEILYNSDKVGG